MSRERRSERRRIAHRRSRSLSFNSQSFDTAVPGCPRVVRKIPRIVFIEVRGRRVQPRGLFLSISLLRPLFATAPSLTPPSYRRRFFLAFETGSGARTMVFTIVRPGVPRENGSHRSRSNGGNRAVSSFLADHFARATFAKSPPPRTGAFLPRNPHAEFIAIGSPAAAAFLVNRYDGLS